MGKQSHRKIVGCTKKRNLCHLQFAYIDLVLQGEAVRYIRKHWSVTAFKVRLRSASYMYPRHYVT